MSTYSPSHPAFWLEFKLLSDGLETAAVKDLPLTTFHAARNPVFRLFPALPAELRLKVWEYMIAPRIVGIACLCLQGGGSSVEIQRDELWGSRTSGPAASGRAAIPVLLHVSHEARALALAHYELSFEWAVPRALAGTEFYTRAPVRPPAPPPLHPTAPAHLAGSPLQDPDLSSPPSLRGSLTPPFVDHEHGPPDQESSTRAQPPLLPPPPAVVERRTSSPARTWFNFGLDAVYLLGELSPCDSFGVHSPMTYFIPSQTTRRVRKIAVSFGALRYGETGGQQIFGALFHVVDRFTPADGKVLVCVTEHDEWTHAMMGNETGLVDGRALSQAAYLGGGSALRIAYGRTLSDPEDNVVQKIWRDWYRGSIVTSPLAKMEFVLIRENDLERYVYNFMISGPSEKRKEKVIAEEGSKQKRP
ncbi:hypothetical protein F5Y19DRAFT_199846 [Xylariaceae sp. FL1651]|nr:hypothetical protein F5Y19DRAFT_199846 [Xylariaceae sp. FL1651]